MSKQTATSSVAAVFAVALCALANPTSALMPDTNSGLYKGDFAVSSKSVIPDTRYIARFRVLGAEISSGGAYDMPVTTRIKIAGKSFEPFGGLNAPTTGNVNDKDHPKDFILEDHVPAGSAFSIEATSWTKSSSYSGGGSNTDWKSYLTVSTSSASANLLVLRNGDLVPAIAPFQEQEQISHLIRDHINPSTGKVVIADDEVIFLFELGTTNLGSAAADFQDLVVLVTLADDKSRFEGPRIAPVLQFD